MAMDQEVIDVKLFITCRLCLDEPGSYQIVPLIKRHINFCFGIDIYPFDGLPQLICKKCKSILTEYYATKNLFLEKQKQLHNKLPKDKLILPKTEGVKSPSAADVTPNGNSEELAVPADLACPGNSGKSAGAKLHKNNDAIDAQKLILTKTEGVKSPSAADVTPNGNSEELAVPADLACPGNSGKSAGAPDVRPLTRTSVNPAGTVDITPAKVRRRRSSWKKAFNRHFVCTICDKSFLTEKSVKRHSPMHKKIISKHDKLFKNYITVQLNKIDEKKNSTGGLQNVVYNKDKIISARHTSKYHSIYVKKGFTTNDKTDENENVPGKRRMVLSDSSDEKIMKSKKRKSCRLFSSSSTETVVLEENKEPVKLGNKDQQSNPNGVVVININLDETSSDCPKINSELEKKPLLPKRQQVKADVADYKAIQNIVTMCHKNYIKKVQTHTDALNKSTLSESSLKHKVLSLGRKVINKQGFSCTGLLRYMEHKDLDITWTPTSNEMQKKGSNFVRIMTKLKSREDSENDDACWKNLHDISFCRDSGVEASLAPPRETCRSEDEAGLPPAHADEDLPFGFACESSDSNYGNKLLNTTPVANPKQLPKKSLPESKPVLIKANDATVVSPNLISNALEGADIAENNMCLPIITSTTSLSVPVNEKENEEVPVLEKPTPRIKVKPASELMPARALNNQETVEDVWKFNPIQSSLAHRLTNTAIAVEAPMTESLSGFVSSQTLATFDQVACQNDTRSQIGESNRKDVPHRNHDTFITLDSPQFPNTKTRSPFQYFRKILLMFRLKLLELNEELPPHFCCLIKFKLILRQGTKTAIGVLLSLFCSEDTYCFIFKDTNLKMFDPNELSAFWQWELLKIYKGDVVDRILHTAMNAGKEVHENTKLFLCLLKSINLVTEA